MRQYPIGKFTTFCGGPLCPVIVKDYMIFAELVALTNIPGRARYSVPVALLLFFARAVFD